MWTWIANHGDALLIVAGYIASKLGINRARRLTDWIEKNARPAFHEVLIAYRGIPLPRDSVLVDAALKRLVYMAQDVGLTVTPAMRELAEDALRRILLELAAEQVKRALPQIAASAQRAADIVAAGAKP